MTHRAITFHLVIFLTATYNRLSMNSVLVIDDERNIRSLVSRVLAQENIEVHTAGTGKEGIELADQVDPDLALVDLRLPDIDGIQVLRDLRTKHPQTAVIMITAFGHIESVVVAMKNGATDYLEKPFQHLEKLRISVTRALEEVKARREITRLQGMQEGKYRTNQIIGESTTTRRLREVITQLAQSEAHTILVQGESGTGKELVARGLHFESARRNSPFMEVNCAAITETLFESELFGHEKGAFTDAKATKKGLMELADGGTLFLDEVGEIPLELQPKLLRVLQEQAFERLGGTRTIKVDVRLVAATNRDLARLVEEQRFRDDLYYRLNVFPIHVPPLRERPEDIPALVRFFVQRLARPMNRHVEVIPTETLEALRRYAWPGNVRELANLLERAMILSKGRTLEVPLAELERRRPRAHHEDGASTLEDVERTHIRRVLGETNWMLGGPRGAAARLGMKRTTLQSLMRRLGITRPRAA